MSVAEYHARFIQLARFAPQFDVQDETSRTLKFREGLKPEYKTLMARQERIIVEEAYDPALKLEKDAANTRRHSHYRARRSDHRPKKHSSAISFSNLLSPHHYCLMLFLSKFTRRH